MPEAWLLTVARRKLIDASRRRTTGDEDAATVALLADELSAAADEEIEIPDERLRLMFACAHPAIDAGVRAPLILQTALGFDAATIGSAFLVAPATMGQRLVRAKSRIRQAAVQSAHAARRLTGRTDWAGIVQLYDALLGLTNSVVVAINRAVAFGGAHGAARANRQRG